MKSRPILFSGAMVRAILDGTKTQTRRVVKGIPSWDHCGRDIMDWGLSDCYTDEQGIHWLDVQTDVDDNSHNQIKCPYGQVGDRLKVKESAWMWCAKLISGLTKKTNKPKVCWVECRNVNPIYCEDQAESPTHVPAGSVEKIGNLTYQWRKKIGRFLPAWASRIELEITGIRVERLNEISEDDAVTEGILPDETLPNSHWKQYGMNGGTRCPIFSYQTLWESINGPGSWAKNPFVWVLEFKRIS